MDSRDQIVKEALDRTVGAYRPEKTLRSRLRRVAIVAALALAAFLGFAAILHHSVLQPAPASTERKPVSVRILPATK
jgi:hypothetical protein